MPVKKCSNDKWQIGNGPCMYKSKEKAERAYRAYLAQGGEKHDTIENHPEMFDAINLSKMIDLIGGKEEFGAFSGFKSVSLVKFSKIAKYIKSNISFKTEHMAIGPERVELPAKGMSRLQTKLERITTEEQKFVTAEERERRSKYAKNVKKIDSEHDPEMDIIEEYILNIIKENKEKENLDEIISDSLIKYTLINDNIYGDSEAKMKTPNPSMKNIIKAPIILAKEMIQEYQFLNDDGSIRTERHYKDYHELKKSIKDLDILYMILEHKKSWNIENTLGCVRELKADDSKRLIRGTGYFVESKCPKFLLDQLHQRKPVQVSIGFLADLGPGGFFAGQKYDFSQTNIILDHLAVCFDSQARCPLPQCGVNVDSVKTTEELNNDEIFTIISKPDYYYNISKIFSINDSIDINTGDNKETISNTNIEERSNGDSMEDSFPDPKSGKLPDDKNSEPLPIKQILTQLRAYLGGLANPDELEALRRELLKITQFSSGKKEQKKIKAGDNIMDEKEFNDAIALKDEKIKEQEQRIQKLEKMIMDGKIKSIKNLTDKFSDEELQSKKLEELDLLFDAISRFTPSNEKAPVIPIKGKDEKKVEETIEDSQKPKRTDFSNMFAETSKDFDMSGL